MPIINSRSEIQRNIMNLTFEEGSIRSINDELKLNSINAVLKIGYGLETARTLFQALTEDKITNVHNIVYNLCAYIYNLDYTFELSLLLGSEYKFSIVRTNKHFKLSVSRIDGESYKKVASYKIKHTGQYSKINAISVIDIKVMEIASILSKWFRYESKEKDNILYHILEILKESLNNDREYLDIQNIHIGNGAIENEGEN